MVVSIRTCRVGVAAVFLLVLLSPAASWSQGSADPKVIEAAKKEGEVVWYSSMTLEQGEQVVVRFQKKYPFIKATHFRTGSGSLLNKILTEAQGERHAWDVVGGRGEMVLPLIKRKLVARYRSLQATMIDEDLVDNESYWTAYYVNTYVLGYNTKLVKKEDVPRTYEALLDAKWKSRKISVDTNAYGMLQGLIGLWGKEKAVSYFKRLAAQDPDLTRGHNLRIQLAAAGEYPLVIAWNVVIQRMTSSGAPIDWIPLEPAVVQVNTVMLAARAPHPNAGKLFIDFLLSKEGQEMFRDFQSVPVRKDVDPDPPRLFRGFKRVIEHPEGYENFDETVKLYLEIFKLR